MDYETSDLSNHACDTKNRADEAVHAARGGRFGEAAKFARLARESAQSAARAAAEVERLCSERPPHKCEICGEAVRSVDEYGVCPTCAALDGAGRHAVLSARVERERRR